MSATPPISAQPRQDAAHLTEERRRRLGPDAVRRAHETAAPAPEFTERQKSALALLLARTGPIEKRGAA